MDDKELDLVKKAQTGDSESMEALIARYMWIARSKARKYFLVSGSYDDLLQEGLMGIFKGIRDYDPEKNDNLSAFISMCVGSQIKDAIRSSSRAKHKLLNDAVSLDGLDNNLPSEFIYDPVHNYIERIGNYSQCKYPIGFFTYIEGGLISTIDSQIRKEVDESGVNRLAITVSNFIKMIEIAQKKPYSHDRLKEI